MPDTRARSRRANRAIRHRRQRRTRLALLIAAVVVIASAAIVLALRDGGSDGVVTARVRLIDFAIVGDLEVPAGEIRLEAVNDGGEPHNIGIRGGPVSNQVNPGGTISLDLGDLEPGTYELYCDIEGHLEKGMTSPFVVAPQ